MEKYLRFKKRNLWAMLGLLIITLGFYYFYWFYKTNKGLKVYDKKAPNHWSLLILIGSSLPLSILTGILISISKSINSLRILFIIIFILSLGFLLFRFIYYFKLYSRSMSKVTGLISKMGCFWIIILVPFLIFLIQIILILFLGKASIIFMILNLILSISSFCSIIYFQSIYNKVSSQKTNKGRIKNKNNEYYNSIISKNDSNISKEIPKGNDYDYNMKIETISPNKEIAKQYIGEYKTTYTKEVLLTGLINHGISPNESEKYLEKYYIGKIKSEIKHSKKGLNKFFTKIYFWMFVGIIITMLTSIITTYFDFLYYGIYGSYFVYYGFVAIQLILLFGTQLLINYFSPKISLLLFLLYSMVIGISITGIFMIYNLNSILVIFIVASSMFGILALIGFITKKNLSKWGSFLIPAMWGVFIVSLLNIYFQSNITDFIVSIISVIVFSGLTIYDNQAYQNIYKEIKSKEDYKRYVVLGAMHMYINFIMIFINLLKLFRSRD